MTRSFKASIIALSIAALPFAVHGAGLGQIRVFSALGQPLRAEIPVSATPEELRSLSARIASPEAFRQADLGYGSAARAIRLSVDARASGAVIHLSSERPIDDPFVDLLVELNWAAGRLVREYTFLLDPVDFATPGALAAAAVDPPAVLPVQRPPSSAPESVSPSAPRSAAPASVPPSTYVVNRGDTLYRIASAHLQPGMTLDQMLVALHRTNPDAFAGGNINRLRAGSVLSLPAPSAVRAFSTEQAQREIRAQAADFDAYRRGLAAAVEDRAPVPAPADEQAGAGRIVPRVDAPAPGEDSADQLRVSRSRLAGSGEAEQRLQALEEELGSRERSLDEAAARLALLENSIRGLQRLLELQDGTMGRLQEQAAPAAPSAREGEAGRGLNAQPAAAGAEVAGVPQAAPPPAQRAALPPAAGNEPGVLETVLGNSKLLLGGAAILVLLLAYAGLRQRRRQAAQRVAGAREDGVEGAAFAGSEGQDAGLAASIMNTDFGQSGLSSIDTDEGVDPVAEADVYMAYGRDAQAEEILQDALKTDPKRAAIYLKLLEIYAPRGDSSRFGDVERKLFALTAGHGREWEKAAALGRKLDPKNPRYQEPRAEEPVAPPAGARADGRGGAGGAPAAVVLGGVLHASQGAAEEASGAHQEAAIPHALDFTVPVPQPGVHAEHGGAPGAASRSAAEAGGGMPPATLPEASADQARSAAGVAPPGGAEAVGSAPFAEPAPAAPATGGGRAAEASVQTDSAAAVQEEAGLAFDFDLDFGAGAEDADPAGRDRSAQDHPEGAEPGAPLDFELPDLELEAPQPWAVDMDATVVCPDEAGGVFDEERPGSTANRGAGFAPAFASGLGEAGGASTAPDFDFGLDEPAPAAVPADAAPGLDLSAIDLELDELDEAGISVTEIPGVGEAAADAGADLALAPSYGADDGTETKLELARAYEEMGDREGAIELLQEVIGEGSAAQQAAAREMLSGLN